MHVRARGAGGLGNRSLIRKELWVVAAVGAFAVARLSPTLDGLTSLGQSVLGAAAAGTIIWVTEAIPLGLTALLVTVLLVIAILTLWSPVPLWGMIVLLGTTGWFGVSRLVRAETLIAKRVEYVDAARALGTPTTRVLWRHILPNVVSPVIVAATLAVGNVIALEAGLSFLGVGVPPEIPTWGTMLADARIYISTAWWLPLFPGLCIFITVLGINLLGDALRDILDPRLKRTG